MTFAGRKSNICAHAMPLTGVNGNTCAQMLLFAGGDGTMSAQGVLKDLGVAPSTLLSNVLEEGARDVAALGVVLPSVAGLFEELEGLSPAPCGDGVLQGAAGEDAPESSEATTLDAEDGADVFHLGDGRGAEEVDDGIDDGLAGGGGMGVEGGNCQS